MRIVRSSKRKFLSVIFVLVFSLVGFTVPAANDGGTFHVEARDLPTIVLDGVISVGEWGDPDFTGTQTRPNIGSFNIYVESDDTYLYIAAEYTGNNFSLAQDLGLATALNIYIDSNNNGDVIDEPDNGDIGVIASDDKLLFPYSPSTNDWDWQGEGSLSAAGGGAKANGDYTTGNGIVEVKIPFSLLQSNGEGAWPGSTIGVLFQAFGNDSCPYVEDAHPDWPSTYTDLTLPTPPPPPVGGTICPSNKLALLTPWIALGLVIIAGAIIFLRRRASGANYWLR